jgi:hypothetical protein
MKKIVLVLGALAALFSFSAYNINPTYLAAGESDIGSRVGIVYPTNVPPCNINVSRVDPPLPKGVPHATWWNTDVPPPKYRGNAVVTVYFEDPNQIQTEMTHNVACKGTFFAYQVNKEMHMPNPCTYPKTDAYARLLCHELGHRNGWPAWHGDK